MLILANYKTLPKVQLTIMLASIAYFSTIDAGVSALYGGVISLINTALITRHTNKQKKDATISAQIALWMMVISVIMRMAIVVGLTLTGYFVLELNADALIIGLVLGLIGFLLDKALYR
ncbi:ATP synthase subunit I [Bathymodiolus septemdierum thioautotrophic gill symbiont]|uniref:ATP synthase subunit I n=1 Tax=Bathymodiolus septemdierum thioautotrophic gill symbiont TaxID=113267 RepID=UPI0038B5088E